jgi:hypothetical protein
MKTVTIQFEFPEVYEHEEIVATINGAICDTDKLLADNLTYTIVGRK